jgi:outer membrane receptor protein involved in Fe transport
MQKLMKVLGITLVLLLLAALAFGQTETGQITGTVKDKSGAVVPNAKVTATAVETGVTREAKSNAAGLYTFPALKPTTYKVIVEAQGFEKFERVVTVNVSTNIDISPSLVVGATSTVVEVSATSADVAVNTENQTISTVITSNDLENLPTTADRNPYALVANSNNVTEDSNSNRGAGFSINGQRSASTSILLDGAENVDAYTAQVGQPVPLDSVQEFSVLTNNFGAEFGRASGGVVNLITKSGTNQFHGSAYEFNRISGDSANTYYNDANGLKKPVFVRNNFGFSIGGPVIKNKLFFFENLEWLRVRSTGEVGATIIDSSSYGLLGGDAKTFMNTYGKNLRSSLKQVSQAPCSSGTYGSLLLCDVVSYGVPTDAGGGNPENTWDQVAKVDYTINSKTTLSGRYAGYHQVNLDGVVNNSPYAGYDTGETMFDQNVAITLTRMVTSNLVNTTKLIYNRMYDFQPLAGSMPSMPTLFSTGSVPTVGGQILQFPGYMQTNPGNTIPFGGPQNLYQVYDDISWTKGKHQLKFGGQFIHLRDNRTFGAYENAVELIGSSLEGTTKIQSGTYQNLINGNIYEYEGAVNPQGEYPCYRDPVTGSAIQTAACTLQLPVNEPSFSRHYRYNDAALYAQDAIKVTPRLTVNLGLRWEYYGVQHNDNSALDSNFVLAPAGNIFDQVRYGQVELSKDGGKFWKPQYHNYGPRIGFAWDPTGKGKTSIRGGYSIGYERNFGNVTFNAIQNPPNYGVVQLYGQGPSAIGTLPVYLTNAGPLAGGSGITSLPFPSVSQRAINQNMKTAYAETWNLGVEQSVANNAIVTIQYAGSHGVHDYDIANLNPSSGGGIYLGDGGGSGYNSYYSAGNRPNLQYSNMNYRSDNGYSHYDALMLGFRANNLRHTGVTLNANYQWSHALDNLSSTFSENYGQQSGLYQLGYIDAFNPKLNYGNADYDIRHRFQTSASWELPWFKNSTNKVERYALGGWVVGGNLNIRSGMPFTIYDCSNQNDTSCPVYSPVSGTVAKSGKPTSPSGGYSNYITIPTDPSANPVTGAKAGHVVDAGNALGMPNCSGLYHLGCSYVVETGTSYAARNQYKGPNFWNSDIQFLKNFKFSERLGLQLRGELYDIFNHHNQYIAAYGLDVSGMKASNASNYIQTEKGGKFGVPGQSTDEHRTIDFGAKITF